MKKRRGKMTFEFFNDESSYVLKKSITPEVQARIMARLGRSAFGID